MKLGISVRRVQALVESGKLPAEKIGNSFVIKESDLKLVRKRKSGRPLNGGKPEQKDWNATLNRFIGKFSFGPRDLATNKKHMEGFGRD